MIGQINHIAIAVPDVTAAAQHWQTMLGATVSAVQTLPEHCLLYTSDAADE